jgi:hypothetical protein
MDLIRGTFYFQNARIRIDDGTPSGPPWPSGRAIPPGWSVGAKPRRCAGYRLARRHAFPVRRIRLCELPHTRCPKCGAYFVSQALQVSPAFWTTHNFQISLDGRRLKAILENYYFPNRARPLMTE